MNKQSQVQLALFIDEITPLLGGSELQVTRLLKHLPENYQVTIFTLRQQEAFPLPGNKGNLKHIDLGFHSWMSPSGYGRVIPQLSQAGHNAYDVAIGFLRDGTLMAWLAARWFLKCRFISTKRYFENYANRVSWKERFKERTLLVAHRRADAVFVNASVIARQLELFGVAPTKLQVILNAMEPRPAASPKAVGPSFDIVCISNLRKIKDLPTLFKAIARVRRSIPKVSLAVIGEGRERAALESTIDRLDIAGNVTLLGYCDDPGVYLANTKIGALASLAEGSPNALLEYMMYGLPVVSTNVGGSVELVDEAHTGYLVDPGDVDTFADRIIELLSDEHLREAYGSAAKASLTRHHPNAVSAQFDRAVREMLAS